MKNIFNYKQCSIFICTIIFFGCGKQKVDLLKSRPDIYFSIYMPQAVNLPAVYQFNFSGNRDSIIYGANFGGPGTLAKDIQVSFMYDSALVSKYNAANFTKYKPMPEGSYSFEQSTATLTAVKRSTEALKLSIFTAKLDGVGGYLLPVTIKNDGNVAVKESLKTTYFLVSGVYASNPYPLFDNTTWKIISVSSEEKTGEGLTNGRAIFAFDKNPDTFWSTEWKANKPGPPHIIVVDMLTPQKLHGFSFTGRKDAATGLVRTTGNPRDIVIQTSADGITWTYNQSFALSNILVNTLYLNYSQTARFFKLTVNASQSDNYLTQIAELTAF
jgi:hypothetical protein